MMLQRILASSHNVSLLRELPVRQLFQVGQPVVGDYHQESSTSEDSEYKGTNSSTSLGTGHNIIYHPNRFNNKVAVVTASSSGIGKSIARRLYLEGANVVISSRKQENVDGAIRDILASFPNRSDVKRTNSISGIVCHVGKDDHRRRLVDFTLEKYGRIDCFLSNAGVNPHVGPIETITEEQLDKIYDINLKSVVMLTQLLLPHLRETSRIHHGQIDGKGGSVVFISSMGAILGSTNLGGYASAKAALFPLTKVLARECSKDNIRFNCVAPGPIDTTFANVLKCPRRSGDELVQSILMKRFGKADELDGLVAYLLSEEASYVTGEVIVVSGGLHGRI